MPAASTLPATTALPYSLAVAHSICCGLVFVSNTQLSQYLSITHSTMHLTTLIAVMLVCLSLIVQMLSAGTKSTFGSRRMNGSQVAIYATHRSFAQRNPHWRYRRCKDRIVVCCLGRCLEAKLLNSCWMHQVDSAIMSWMAQVSQGHSTIHNRTSHFPWQDFAGARLSADN